MHSERPHRRRDIAPRQANSSASAVAVISSGAVSNSTAVFTPLPTSSSAGTNQTGTTSDSTAALSHSSSTVSNATSSSFTGGATSTTQISTTSPSAPPSETLQLFSFHLSRTFVSSTTSASRFSTTIVFSASTSQSTSVPIPTSSPATLIVTESPSDIPTSITSTSTFSSSATNEPQSGLANGFWQNTGAVAGTFTALGIFILGIIAAFVFLRRRRARRTQSDDEFFEKLAVTSGRGDRDSVPTTSSHHSSTELVGQAPMDPYPGNQMYNTNYGPDFQPGTSYGLTSVNEGAIGYPSYSNPQMIHTYYTPPPGRGVHNGQAPLRRSYQLSIDSFYGASS